MFFKKKLCRIIDPTCCMAMVLISLNVCLMAVSGILKAESPNIICPVSIHFSPRQCM